MYREYGKGHGMSDLDLDWPGRTRRQRTATLQAKHVIDRGEAEITKPVLVRPLAPAFA